MSKAVSHKCFKLFFSFLVKVNKTKGLLYSMLLKLICHCVSFTWYLKKKYQLIHSNKKNDIFVKHFFVCCFCTLKMHKENYAYWDNLSKRGGTDGVFSMAGRAAPRTSQRQIPKNSPASQRKTLSFPMLLLRFTCYLQFLLQLYQMHTMVLQNICLSWLKLSVNCKKKKKKRKT